MIWEFKVKGTFIIKINEKNIIQKEEENKLTKYLNRHIQENEMYVRDCVPHFYNLIESRSNILLNFKWTCPASFEAQKHGAFGICCYQLLTENVEE